MSVRKPIAIAAMTMLATGLFVGSAQASARGSEPFGGGTVPTPRGDYPVPQGELDHGVTGTGLYVESQAAGFTAVPPLCNWTMTYELRDLNGGVVDSATIDPGSDLRKSKGDTTVDVLTSSPVSSRK